MYKILPLTVSLLSLGSTVLSCALVGGVKLTNYGWPDLPKPPQPPAFKCQGTTKVPSQAGDTPVLGDGSFGKPYSAAISTTSDFNDCELIYIPILEKYFRITDHCSGCTPKWIDLYLIQSNSDIGQSNCEQQFGVLNIDGNHPLHNVLRDPGQGYLTNTQSLFQNGKCYNNPSDNRVFPTRDDVARCAATDNVAAGANSVSPSVDAVDNSNHALDLDPAARHSATSTAASTGPTASTFTA